MLAPAKELNYSFHIDDQCIDISQNTSMRFLMPTTCRYLYYKKNPHQISTSEWGGKDSANIKQTCYLVAKHIL